MVDIKASINNTCALLVGGYVICWGDNTSNQVGLGHTHSEAAFPPYKLTNADGGVAGPISLGGHATAISVGVLHACALLQGGAVQCWGDNQNGELGIGNTTQYLNATPNTIPRTFDGGVTGISTAGGTTCAVLSSEIVTCWGDNTYGQIGVDSTTSPLPTPGSNQLVSLAAGAVTVAVGDLSACALLTTGAVECWGDYQYGEVGVVSRVHANRTRRHRHPIGGISIVGFGRQWTRLCAHRQLRPMLGRSRLG